MKKGILLLVLAGLLLSSCGTYTGAGAYAGGQFGAIIGSAIGGISDGRRGSDYGTLIGMAGGAIIGAVVGNAADRAQAERIEDYRRRRVEREADATATAPDDGVFDPTNSGDDRIVFNTDSVAATPVTPAVPATPAAPREISLDEGLQILNARFIDANGDGVLVAGEECKIVFEIMNRTGRPVYDVQPVVMEMENNRHIHISQNLHIESIMPGKGIRYTATIKGGSRLREGTARIRVGIVVNNEQLPSQLREFVIQTRRK